MTDSVDGDDSDLIPLEKLSLDQELCYSRLCRCNQKQLKCRARSSQFSNYSALCWPPRQTNRVVKTSTRQTSALKLSAAIKCLSKAEISSLIVTQPGTGSVEEKLAWGRADIKTDFSDLVCTAGNVPFPSKSYIDFTSSAFRSFGQRTASNITAERPSNAAKRNTDIVLSDLKSVLLSEDRNLHACDSNSRAASDCSQSGHSVMPCSQQALVSDDAYEVDELAGYFEYYCHIPKKMSEMAKMMYA